jgi:hypothetical protein
MLSADDSRSLLDLYDLEMRADLNLEVVHQKI